MKNKYIIVFVFIILSFLVFLYFYEPNKIKQKMNIIIENDLENKIIMSTWWGECNWPCWEDKYIFTKDIIITYLSWQDWDFYYETPMDKVKWQKLISSFDWDSFKSVKLPNHCKSCFDARDTWLTIFYKWHKINIDYDALFWQYPFWKRKEVLLSWITWNEKEINKVVQFIDNFLDIEKDKK